LQTNLDNLDAAEKVSKKIITEQQIQQPNPTSEQNLLSIFSENPEQTLNDLMNLMQNPPKTITKEARKVAPPPQKKEAQKVSKGLQKRIVEEEEEEEDILEVLERQNRNNNRPNEDDPYNPLIPTQLQALPWGFEPENEDQLIQDADAIKAHFASLPTKMESLFVLMSDLQKMYNRFYFGSRHAPLIDGLNRMYDEKDEDKIRQLQNVQRNLINHFFSGEDAIRTRRATILALRPLMITALFPFVEIKGVNNQGRFDISLDISRDYVRKAQMITNGSPEILDAPDTAAKKREDIVRLSNFFTKGKKKNCRVNFYEHRYPQNDIKTNHGKTFEETIKRDLKDRVRIASETFQNIKSRVDHLNSKNDDFVAAGRTFIRDIADIIIDAYEPYLQEVFQSKGIPMPDLKNINVLKEAIEKAKKIEDEKGNGAELKALQALMVNIIERFLFDQRYMPASQKKSILTFRRNIAPSLKHKERMSDKPPK
jgi:hypothetical protein